MHIINKLMALLLFVCLMSLLPSQFLLAIETITIVLAGIFANTLFYSLFKKMKWVLISITFVYALTTPGQLLFDYTNDLNVVTIEGLLHAAEQTLHLMTMLAAVALLLYTSSKECLIAGFYQLGKLVFHHDTVSRFVVRLWLVLHYFEQQPIRIKNINSTLTQFEHSQMEEDENLHTVDINLQAYYVRDYLTLFAMVTMSLIALRYFK